MVFSEAMTFLNMR